MGRAVAVGRLFLRTNLLVVVLPLAGGVLVSAGVFQVVTKLGAETSTFLGVSSSAGKDLSGNISETMSRLTGTLEMPEHLPDADETRDALAALDGIRTWVDQSHPLPSIQQKRLEMVGLHLEPVDVARLDATPAKNAREGIVVMSWWPDATRSGGGTLGIQYRAMANSEVLGKMEKAMGTLLFVNPEAQAWKKTHAPPLSVQSPSFEVRSGGARVNDYWVIIHLTGQVLGYFLFVALGLTAGLSKWWDVARKKGELEMFALSPSALWPLYVGQLMAKSVGFLALVIPPVVVFSCLCPKDQLLAWLGYIVPMVVLGYVLVFSSGILSVLSVMMFHHPLGRALAGPLLFPVSMMVGISARPLYFLLKDKDTTTLLFGHVLLFTPSLVPLWVAAFQAVVMVPLLIHLTERRIGRQRTGLRELK
jgi:hypothetical protein